MYGKRRVSISRTGRIDLRGGRSCQQLGWAHKCGDGYRVTFRSGRFVAHVKTQREAKVAIFNAAKTLDEWFSGHAESIDSAGRISPKADR